MHAGAPIAWGCTRHKDTAQSSCQAEVHSINETTKLILEYKLLFRDLNLPLTTPVPILNDNQGAIQWSKGTTTKKMRTIFSLKLIQRIFLVVVPSNGPKAPPLRKCAGSI